MPGHVPKYWDVVPKGGTGAWYLYPKDEKWARSAKERLRSGKPMHPSEWPSPPPVFTYEVRYPSLQDMPECVNGIYIVSDRLRAFFEQEAPGALEYHPITLEGPGADSIRTSFWATNWVRTLNILDEAASYNTDSRGERFVEVPVIDPRLAPLDGVLGLLGDYTVTRLIRDDLKKKIEASGFTGLYLLRAFHSGEENWVKPDYQRKTKRKKKAGG